MALGDCALPLLHTCRVKCRVVQLSWSLLSWVGVALAWHLLWSESATATQHMLNQAASPQRQGEQRQRELAYLKLGKLAGKGLLGVSHRRDPSEATPPAPAHAPHGTHHAGKVRHASSALWVGCTLSLACTATPCTCINKVIRPGCRVMLRGSQLRHCDLRHIVRRGG